ncbi:MAG: alpha/beta hydrolase, partial [Candidatus Magasanikbacteria bacterium CG_4_9_14_3_um_filter_32_9]
MTNTKDYVVLLHGFWRTSKSMKKLEKILNKDGYLVVNLDYPSRKEKIEDISNNYLKKVLLD